MIVLIAGVIVFILAIVYVCYNGYIFTNEVVVLRFYIDVDPTNPGTHITGINYNDVYTVERLYLNGAIYKWIQGENPDNHDDKDYGKYFTKYEKDRAILKIK